MDFGDLLDLAIERVKPYLPENIEIDDVGWGDGIFQICLFDVSRFPGRLVDRFRFFRNAGETEEELIQRFDEEVDSYAKGWRS